MINFTCDYTRAGCQEVMNAIAKASGQYPGYSEDKITARAKESVKRKCNCTDSDVHFLVGGTQTNCTFISSVLRPHEGVIASATGHINVHETGAIESTGHKVLVIESGDGKIKASTLDKYISDNFNDPNFEHIVKAGMVYISNSTEIGTIYHKHELEELHEVCQRHCIPLYMDGARLGYAMATAENDLTLHDLTLLTDAFYIGGTKQGALFGEALVINNNALKKDFRYIMKQRGALMAKGFLLGAQFEALMQGDTYERYSRHAIEQAQRIRKTLKAKNIPLLIDSPTNQILPIFTNAQLDKLSDRFIFDHWCHPDENTTQVRIATDWSTCEEDVTELINELNKI